MKKRERSSGRYFGALRPHWLLLTGTLLLALACVACQLYVPILAGRAVDCMFGPGQVDFTALAGILLWIGLAAGAGALTQWCMGELNNRITFQVVRQMREEAFRHIQELPPFVLGPASSWGRQ